MINKKDVLIIKFPYPHICSELARTAHMYIVKEKVENTFSLVKAQTWKPQHITGRNIHKYCVEESDIERNPFVEKTTIDCDKIFKIENVNISDKAKTDRRPDICGELMNKIDSKLDEDGYVVILPDRKNTLHLNRYITDVYNDYIEGN